MSPPRLTRAPQPAARAILAAARSAASAFAVAPRSSSTPGGILAVCRSSSSSSRRQSTTAANFGANLRPSRPATRANVVSYPARRSVRPTIGLTIPSVSSAARTATESASRRSALTWRGSPRAWFRWASSESERKRLAARSSSSSSRTRSARAAGSATGSVTTTRAVVPIASNTEAWSAVTSLPRLQPAAPPPPRGVQQARAAPLGHHQAESPKARSRAARASSRPLREWRTQSGRPSSDASSPPRALRSHRTARQTAQSQLGGAVVLCPRLGARTSTARRRASCRSPSLWSMREEDQSEMKSR